MDMKNEELRVSSPGRICLFGEHQDYLGLAIIAAAINLRITISGKRRSDKIFAIDLPDIGEKEKFSSDQEIPYAKKRDYLKSAVNIHRRQGMPLTGWDCLVRGTIPINAGTSSSSALVVAWNKFLLEAAGDKRARVPEEIAELGYLTEVAEFKEPGGKMDHYTSALGGAVWIQFDEPMKLTKLENPLQTFVLANSLEKKDTTGTLGFIKSHVLNGTARVREKIPSFSLKSPLTADVLKEIDRLDADHKRLLKGSLLTRDLTQEGVSLFQKRPFDHQKFGALLTAQHKVLRDLVQISTPKIERMMRSALDAGAFGAKINGSGGGGCMFAYAPNEPQKVAEAVERAGGQPYIVHIDEGARREL